MEGITELMEGITEYVRKRKSEVGCVVCKWDFGLQTKVGPNHVCAVCANFVPAHIPNSQKRKFVQEKLLKENNYKLHYDKDNRLSQKSIDLMVDLIMEKEKKDKWGL